MLTNRKLLITGVANAESIAFAIAERAQLQNAEVVLGAFPRDLEAAKETARLLPRPAPVLALDVTRQEHLDALADDLGARWGRLDGVVHAVAFAPRTALGGSITAASADAAELAFRTSVWSYVALAGLLDRLAPPEGGAIVGLDFDAGARAWPVYNWMGVCKAALQAACRYVARDLGSRGIRANLVAAGPLHTRAADAIPGFDQLLDAWATTAPLAWEPRDATPVAEAAVFLLSDQSRMVTGEVLHADAGFHAMAAPLPAQIRRTEVRDSPHSTAGVSNDA